MKNLFFAIILFCFPPCLLKAGWEREFGAPMGRMDQVKTLENGYIAVGYGDNYYESGYWFGKSYAIRLDEEGNTIWLRDFERGRHCLLNSVLPIEDGYIVSGCVSGDGAYSNYYGWLTKLDTNGEVVWSKNYGGGFWDWLGKIIQTSDGNYVVAGYSWSFGMMFRAWIIKFDGNGNVIWERNYGGVSFWIVQNIIETSEHSLMVGGEAVFADTTNQTQFFLLKLNADGDSIEIKEYGNRFLDDELYHFISTDDGGYILVGSAVSRDEVYSKGYIVKVDSFGNEQWSKLYELTPYTGIADIVSIENGYMIGGFYNQSPTGYDSFLMKLDTNGDSIWIQIYTGRNDNTIASIDKTYDNGYVAAGMNGWIGHGEDSRMWVIKVDSLGLTPVAEKISFENSDLVAYPNPFNQSVRIRLPNNCKEVEIINNLGQRIDILEGENVVIWTPKNVPSGLYFIKVGNGFKPFLTKIVYLK